MGISGTGVGGTAQPPQIRESETQAVELMKKNVLAMLPPDTLEVIPFTQREYDEVFKYKSEADRPMILPLLYLRFAITEEVKTKEDAWQTIYEALVRAMPESLQKWLKEEMEKPFAGRDPNWVVVNNLLTASAKTAAWLEAAAAPMAPDSPAEANYLLNITLPFVAMRALIGQSESVLARAESWLGEVGPNYPHYDILHNTLDQMSGWIDTLNVLRQEVENGNRTPTVMQRLTDAASKINTLKETFQHAVVGNELQIVAPTLNALAVVSSAWALSSGSPSLLLASTIASTGLSENNNASGVQGEAYSTLVNTLLDGLHGSFLSGPRAEHDELQDLYNSLDAMREREGGSHG